MYKFDPKKPLDEAGKEIVLPDSQKKIIKTEVVEETKNMTFTIAQYERDISNLKDEKSKHAKRMNTAIKFLEDEITAAKSELNIV